MSTNNAKRGRPSTHRGSGPAPHRGGAQKPKDRPVTSAPASTPPSQGRQQCSTNETRHPPAAFQSDSDSDSDDDRCFAPGPTEDIDADERFVDESLDFNLDEILGDIAPEVHAVVDRLSKSDTKVILLWLVARIEQLKRRFLDERLLRSDCLLDEPEPEQADDESGSVLTGDGLKLLRDFIFAKSLSGAFPISFKETGPKAIMDDLRDNPAAFDLEEGWDADPVAVKSLQSTVSYEYNEVRKFVKRQVSKGIATRMDLVTMTRSILGIVAVTRDQKRLFAVLRKLLEEDSTKSFWDTVDHKFEALRKLPLIEAERSLSDYKTADLAKYPKREREDSSGQSANGTPVTKRRKVSVDGAYANNAHKSS